MQEGEEEEEQHGSITIGPGLQVEQVEAREGEEEEQHGA